MKLAIISPGALPVPAVKGGAVETLTTYLLTGNEKSGTFEIDLYTISDVKLNRIQIEHANILQMHQGIFNHLLHRAKYFLYHKILKGKYGAEYTELLCKEIGKHDYDYVLVENQFHLLNDIYDRTKHKENLVIHLHNGMDNSRSAKSAKIASERAKGIIVVSDYLKKLYSTCMDQNKIYVLPNCVSDLFIKSNPKQNRNCYRMKYGIEEEDFLFYFSGRIEPYKGIMELINAFGVLTKKYNHIRLAIVGDDFRKKRRSNRFFKELRAATKPFEEKMVFTDYVLPDEMPFVLSMADAVVIPSTWEEPFGVVALEAMAEEVPVICTKSGALPDILNNGSALIVDKDSDLTGRLESAMEKIMCDRELYQEIANKEKEQMKQHDEYLQMNYFPNFCKVLEKIVQGE